jgi:DNA-binding XRE family transcriptional regulator
MNGDRIRALRELRAWSQARLAEAACVCPRTIQRVESGETAAAETLLSVAAALDVDASTLAVRSGMGSPTASRRRYPPAGGRVAVAAVSAAPCAVFVAVNVAKFRLGWSRPYDELGRIGTQIMPMRAFNEFSPYVFIGGLAVAVLLCVQALLSADLRVQSGTLRLSALRVRLNCGALIVMMIAVACGAAVLTYEGAELLSSLST